MLNGKTMFFLKSQQTHTVVHLKITGYKKLLIPKRRFFCQYNSYVSLSWSFTIAYKYYLEWFSKSADFHTFVKMSARNR